MNKRRVKFRESLRKTNDEKLSFGSIVRILVDMQFETSEMESGPSLSVYIIVMLWMS